MVTTVVRDKYVQSETITERAEEAGELMTRMEENDEILSQSLTIIWQQWKQVGLFFFPHASGGNEWHPQPPSLSLVHPSIKDIYQAHPSGSLQLSNFICHFSVIKTPPEGIKQM